MSLRAILNALIALGFLLVGCNMPRAQDSVQQVDEEGVKAAVKRLTQYDICPNNALLKFIDVDMADCKAHLERFAPYCWQKLDKLQINYSLDVSEQGKERLLDLSVVYAACIKSELFLELVSKRGEGAEQS